MSGDQTFLCRGCSKMFEHSYGEQQWMREQWGNDYRPPTHCKECRDKRRAAKRTVEQGAAG